MRKILACVAAAMLMVGVSVLVGCGEGSEENSASGKGPVTLTFWNDIYTDPASSKAITELIDAFEKDNPGVKIKHVVKPFDQFVPTAKLALQGQGAPDIVICAAADLCNADLVKAGLIIPTDKYAEKYGWFDGIPDELIGTTRHEKDGTTYRGDTYGMSMTYDIVGVYYNKAKLKKLGLGVPKTQAEFERALETAKKAGEVPIMFGDLAKVDLAYTWMQLVSHEMDPDDLRAWQYRKPGSTIDTPGAVAAVQKLKDWHDKGYFTDDLFGIDQHTALERFNSGEGLFVLTGAWWTGMLQSGLGKDAGYFLYPPKGAGDPPRAIHAFSNPINITSKSKHPDLAAKFIAWITSPESAQIRVSNGLNATPLHAVEVEHSPTETGKDVLTELKRLNDDGEPVPWLDASPRMLVEVLGSGLQSVLGGKMSPQELIKKAQAEQASQVKMRVEKGYK